MNAHDAAHLVRLLLGLREGHEPNQTPTATVERTGLHLDAFVDSASRRLQELEASHDEISRRGRGGVTKQSR